MQEAESLCDRLGVFVKGKLRCIGSAQELAGRYSRSLLLSITVPVQQSEALLAAVAQLPSCTNGRARLVAAAGGAHRFEVARESPLAELFSQVQGMATSRGRQQGEFVTANSATGNATRFCPHQVNRHGFTAHCYRCGPRLSTANPVI